MHLRQLEKHPHTFGAAGPLTPSEIHTIDAIGCEGGILMSELAARLSVTKGAITQIIVRLESKELVRRSPHPHDSRGTTISLTDKGKEAYWEHEHYQAEFYEELRSQLNADEIKVFEKCVEKLIKFLQK